MEVVDWIAYDAADGRTESVGGLGGWFGNGVGHRWDVYEAIWEPEAVPYVRAIRDAVLAEDRFTTGEDHQGSPDGVPLFNDGTVGMFSFRGWGDLMAAIATVKDGQDHNYMEFYC